MIPGDYFPQKFFLSRAYNNIYLWHKNFCILIDNCHRVVLYFRILLPRLLLRISLAVPFVRFVFYKIRDLHIIIDGQHVTINQKNFQLRDKDIQVFSLLLENVNSTVSRKEILNKVWRDDKFQMNNALDRSVSHIKKTLKVFPSISISTIYGSGYQMRIKEYK